MWKLGGIVVGSVLGIVAATQAGSYLLHQRGNLGPLEVALIGAVVAVAKDATLAFADPAQTWWEYLRLRERLRELRRELGRSSHANERAIPYDAIRLATDRLIARRPGSVDRSAALTRLVTEMHDCISALSRGSEDVRFCDLSPSMRVKLNTRLSDLHIKAGG
jgi:hypothetical protein